MINRKLLLLLIIALSVQTIKAQLGFSHEVGAIVGPVAFQSDYGVNQNFDTNKGNVGIGIGLVHYINFAYRADCNCYTKDTYFNDHFKLRNEISWNKTKLNHFGEWTHGESQYSRALIGTEGTATVLDIGSQIEYFPYSIRDFAAGGYSFAPYVSLGVHYNSYTPKFEKNAEAQAVEALVATPANLQDETLNIWRAESYTQEQASTWSIVWSVGTRYKLTPLSDLLVDLRWQYYFSDWVDGLNHNGPADKNYDWNLWLNFGYVYYLD
ncbi:THC0290_0291 family protein [Pseudofulvibacter geojedonensis]|uniref:Glutamate dehydrogenase n=1 Tax=Pseudofulvibacter geojedonensis TaxID=1123758 RepID=A0ABW3I080_9FLAO